MNQNEPLSGFGVTVYDGNILLLCKKNDPKTKTFHATISSDGKQFYFYDDTGIIIREDSGFEDVNNLVHTNVSRFGSTYLLVYSRKEQSQYVSCTATSNDAVHWYSSGADITIPEAGVVVPDFQYDGQAVMYGGTSRMYGSASSDLHTWERHPETLYRAKLEKFRIGCAQVLGEKIHVFYFSQSKAGGPHQIKLLRFDTNNPFRRLDSVPVPIWTPSPEIVAQNAVPFGLLLKENILMSYWRAASGDMIMVSHAFGGRPDERVHQKTSFSIRKHHQNPILQPIHDHVWESQAVFNAAAVYEDGKVHLIYRAVGDAGVSMLGHATTTDGITIDTRHHHPIYVPRASFEGGMKPDPTNPSKFISGPSWGGVEDPRLAKVHDRFYLTYVAFNGWQPPRLAMSSISEADFKSENWNWTDPVLISRPGEVNKSGAILPEPVNGKYFVFHRVFPNLLIDELDSLDELDGTRFLEGHYKIEAREDYWDSRKLGVGATPIKTDEGWLVIYHGVDDRDDSRYKIGAMMLDLNDPTRVLARTPHPIIEPTEHYENGLLKYGVVYPCGAVILNGELIVYYGGSDTVLCAATAPAKTFVHQLLTHEQPLLQSKEFYPVVHA